MREARVDDDGISWLSIIITKDDTYSTLNSINESKTDLYAKY